MFPTPQPKPMDRNIYLDKSSGNTYLDLSDTNGRTDMGNIQVKNSQLRPEAHLFQPPMKNNEMEDTTLGRFSPSLINDSLIGCEYDPLYSQLESVEIVSDQQQQQPGIAQPTIPPNVQQCQAVQQQRQNPAQQQQDHVVNTGHQQNVWAAGSIHATNSVQGSGWCRGQQQQQQSVQQQQQQPNMQQYQAVDQRPQEQQQQDVQQQNIPLQVPLPSAAVANGDHVTTGIAKSSVAAENISMPGDLPVMPSITTPEQQMQLAEAISFRKWRARKQKNAKRMASVRRSYPGINKTKQTILQEMSELRHHLDIKDKKINNLQQTINRLKGQLSSRDSWREN